MTISREHAPHDFGLATWPDSTCGVGTDQHVHIVRIICDFETDAVAAGEHERDLAQLGDDLLAEYETNRLRKFRDVTIGCGCRSEQSRVQQGAADCARRH